MPHPPTLRGPPPTSTAATSHGTRREMPPPAFHYQHDRYGHSGPSPPHPPPTHHHPPPRYHPNNPMRMPPTSHYPEPSYNQGPPPPPPPPPPQYYHSRSEPAYGPPPAPWREEPRHAPTYPLRYEYGPREASHHPEEPPHYHVSPRGPPSGIYVPPLHQQAREGPPRMSPPRLTARTPKPQFSRTQDTPTVVTKPSTQTTLVKKKPTSSSKSEKEKQKKGDALDLLAKVSSAMTEDEESDGGTEGTDNNSMDAKPTETMTPPRPREETSPPKSQVFTPKPGHHASEHEAARRITPNTDQRRPYMDHYSRPPPMRYNYAPPPRDFYPPPYYPRTYSPPAVISQRNSFEEGMGLGQEVVYYENEMMDLDHPPQGYHHERYPARTEPYPAHLPPQPLPYTFVQQPRLENKTILRKKFSWKHYPELERFLIANRDEYLRHSALNYTAEQKQYNNWLTERLLELAARHHYIFDSEEFNFVAVRDRIRCYYKSYVQTTRKRGQPLAAAKEKKQTVGATE